MAADLHCHTKLSDGSVGIEDIIVIAQKSGIDTIAITDHDCIAGTVRGQVIGKRYGVTVIPGVELSAFDFEAGKKVHILSYLADAPARLESICKKTSVARKRAGQIMMLKVAARFRTQAAPQTFTNSILCTLLWTQDIPIKFSATFTTHFSVRTASQMFSRRQNTLPLRM